VVTIYVSWRQGDGLVATYLNHRHGDWVMCMRFWGGITRGARFWVRLGL